MHRVQYRFEEGSGLKNYFLDIVGGQREVYSLAEVGKWQKRRLIVISILGVDGLTGCCSRGEYVCSREPKDGHLFCTIGAGSWH